MEFAVALAVLSIALGLVVFVRPASLPPPEAISATVHLDQRKAQIYEGLRDLQFEYRLGKLSDDDYQKAKGNLQRDLATVLAEIDQILGGKSPAKGETGKKTSKITAKSTAGKYVCDKCGASFDQPMKFCGSCGAPMPEVAV